MPVNPDEMLIFKLRAEQKKQKSQQQPVQGPPIIQQQQATPQQTEPGNVEKKPGDRWRPPSRIKDAGKVVSIRTTEPGTTPAGYRVGEIGRIQENIFEDTIMPERLRSMPVMKESISLLQIFAGLALLATAITFGYYVYPQLQYTATYLGSVGFLNFFATINLPYDFTMLNAFFILLTFIGGIRMFSKSQGRGSFGGVSCGLLIIVVLFEYLNSNAQYLLWILMLAFVSVGLVAYSKMSYEGAETEKMLSSLSWPVIEAF